MAREAHGGHSDGHPEGVTMRKTYIVRLTDAERTTLEPVVNTLSGSSQKVRRAQVLLKADADGPAWTDDAIADAFGCRRQTVENVRERFATDGFDLTLNGRARAPRSKVLTGEQEAKVIALRLGPPTTGFANWSLRLLAEKVVALEIAPAVSHETVRRTLKNTR
jgi:transposase